MKAHLEGGVDAYVPSTPTPDGASEPNDLHCSACLSTDFTELGTLGNGEWYRCRSCGTSVRA